MKEEVKVLGRGGGGEGRRRGEAVGAVKFPKKK